MSHLAQSCFVTASVLALLTWQGVGAASCDAEISYRSEPSPFGWPVVPNFKWDNQECWATSYPFCAGSSQSPMDINVQAVSGSCSAASDGELKSLAVYVNQTQVSSVSVSQYMRTVMAQGSFGSLNLMGKDGQEIRFDATQVHVTADSLHTIDGQHAAAEMLIMHKPSGAADLLGGSVVVSVLFTESDTEGSPIFDQLGLSSAQGASWTVSPFGLGATVDAALAGPAYQYNGSVPVPPCSETVTYYVLGQMQKISKTQLQSLKNVLTAQAGGFAKRAPVARTQQGACKGVSANDIHVVPNHEQTTCSSLASPKPMACEASPQCLMSPALTTSGAQTGTSIPIGDLVHYTATEHVTMTPSKTYLEGTVAHGGSFGHLMLNGRMFEAKELELKVVAGHSMDGKRYAGELVIRHFLHGSGSAHGSHGSSEDSSHGSSHDSSHDSHDSHSSHRRLTEHSSSHSEHNEQHVLVSVPLKLGAESPLLRHLGLGKPAVQRAIADGNSYEVHDTIDLSAELQSVMSGDWYWYRTGGGHDCHNVVSKWLQFATPLEVSIEQLNDLTLPLSGMDTTFVRPMDAAATVWKNSLPAHASEAVAECHGSWSHQSAHCWKDEFSTCMGSQQSPINILSAQVSSLGNDNFLAKCSWKPVKGLNVTNSGHGLQVTNNQLGYFAYISDEGNVEYYQVTGMKLHMPAEHMLDNTHYDAELQVVHQRQQAVNHLDEKDVAIASFFFQVGQTENPLLKQFHLPGEMTQEEAERTMELPLDLMRSLGPAMDGSYYRYDGSLTVPDCSEHTKWFVFETPTEMSQAQVDAFKTLIPGGNNRPIQELNGRVLAKNSFMQGTLADHEFWLNRRNGRSRSDWGRSKTLILIPIIFTFFFTIYIMASLFQREDRQIKEVSSGGLTGTGLEQTVGQAQPKKYSRF